MSATPLTAQEVFDTVAKHLFEQGRRAVRQVGEDEGQTTCVYRGERGEKCAVGYLIPDEVYDPGMEGETVFGVLQGVQAKVQEWDQKLAHLLPHIALLQQLQRAHDAPTAWVSTPAMRKRLGDVAATYVLDPAILETLSFKDR